MKNIFWVLLSLSLVFASEDTLQELFPQKNSHLTQEELEILKQSLQEHYKQEGHYKKSKKQADKEAKQQKKCKSGEEDRQKDNQKSYQENKQGTREDEKQENKQRLYKEKSSEQNIESDALKEELRTKGGIKNPNNKEWKEEKDDWVEEDRDVQAMEQKKLRGSVENGEDNPYLGMIQKNIIKEEEVDIIKSQKWIYGISVITTTFLDGSIKRSYGILLKDGLFLTSANMVYDKNIYPRESYAMMQDDSSIPFICVAKLSIKALDLQRGLAILETSSYTDMYCNPERKSFYHDRIYSKHWVDVFEKDDKGKHGVVYSPYISNLNSFYTRRSVVEKSLEALAKEESRDFEGYKYAYGKGYFTLEGKLIGVVGASKDGEPKLKKREEITEFLCELKEKKILKSSYLKEFCPPVLPNEKSDY